MPVHSFLDCTNPISIKEDTLLDEELKSKILSEWGVDGLPFDQQVVRIFEKVRDIPFGRMGSRDPKDVYERNKGTCSGKNFLLTELYQAIGVKTNDIGMPAALEGPDLVSRMIPTESWIYQMSWFKCWRRLRSWTFTTIVQILVDDKWVTVDVTIDLSTQEIGVPIPQNYWGWEIKHAGFVLLARTKCGIVGTAA